MEDRTLFVGWVTWEVDYFAVQVKVSLVPILESEKGKMLREVQQAVADCSCYYCWSCYDRDCLVTKCDSACNSVNNLIPSVDAWATWEIWVVLRKHSKTLRVLQTEPGSIELLEVN